MQISYLHCNTHSVSKSDNYQVPRHKPQNFEKPVKHLKVKEKVTSSIWSRMNSVESAESYITWDIRLFVNSLDSLSSARMDQTDHLKGYFQITLSRLFVLFLK